MWSYILKRLMFVIPTLIGIQTIMFFVSEFVPGGPLDQLYAELRKETTDVMGNGPTEVKSIRAGDVGDDQKREIDPKEEMRMMRQLGLHRNRWERYLRSFIWCSQDSIISSKEFGPPEPGGSTALAVIGDLPVIIYRNENDPERYFVYYNSFKTMVVRKKLVNLPDGTTKEKVLHREETGGVVFDKDRMAFKSVLDNSIFFDFRTGKQIDGDGQLEKIPIEVRKERFSMVRLTVEGKRESVVEERDEVYVKESFWQKISNWNNWHGYFLLKFPVTRQNKKSLDLILERLPVSMRLGIISFFLTYVGCIVLGIIKAVKSGSRFDSFTSFLILTGYSIPGFVLAVLLLQVFGPTDEAVVHLIPLGGLHSPPEIYAKLSLLGKLWDNIHHLIAPIICLTIGSFAGLTLLTRNSVLEQFNQLYAVAARARGLSERKVLIKHILRNSMIPLVTGFPARFLMMFLGGSLLIEQIFNLDGLGLLGFKAVADRDFPLIMSNLFVFTLIGLLCKLLTDICYVIVDPRISFEERK